MVLTLTNIHQPSKRKRDEDDVGDIGKAAKLDDDVLITVFVMLVVTLCLV